jgi:superfamily II DNA or RNA helicase
MEYKAGSLVRVRNRDWVVLPSNNDKLVLLKPLGGSEDEVAGIYLPLAFKEDQIKSTEFPLPSEEDMGDFASARLLYNACRLSFRNGAGPFRSLAKLSFRPRSYQMVPLIMALKQDNPIRLLIADDVGVGKTIEALLVLYELLERREIKRFAIIVLPHLCEQWKEELKNKFGIDAVIIRSNTQARLDREIHGDASVYHHYPYQIISIDYIKSDTRRQLFIQECPEFVIVDEAHSCSTSAGAKSDQQQRHSLVKAISKKPDQHLVLLTATPHSGKADQFNSILGLLKQEYLNLDLPATTQNERKDLAKYYVQRRRANVEKWMGEDTPFPKRDAGEFPYELSNSYSEFYGEMLKFALGLTKTGDTHEGRKRFRYWSALALLRGVMSSPAAGAKMIRNRIKGGHETDTENLYDENEPNPIMDDDFSLARDYVPTEVINQAEWTDSENRRLNKLADQLEALCGIEHDHKISQTLEITKKWLDEGYNPVIFCRFITTANYVGEILKNSLNSKKDINIQVITSEDPDEIRKIRIDEMKTHEQKVLIATDCLSEGINLQDQFTAVLHYDLPWNPNRLEQREGRIDRYGQRADTVKTYLLYGKNNPIDGVVLKVILRKVREIRKSIGISIPFPEDSKSLMDSVFQAVITKGHTDVEKKDPRQITFEFTESDEVKSKEIIVTKEIEKAAEREKATRNIFAQNAIKADEIEEDLRQSDEAIGDPEAVESFVVESLNNLLGVQITKAKNVNGYTLYTTNLPGVLKSVLPENDKLKVSFYSPTPKGYIYFGRNHIFVEQLCQYLLSNSLESRNQYSPARTSVIRTQAVDIKTTILLFRVRNVIAEKQSSTQLVAEEMLLWGYTGNLSDNSILSNEEVKNLMTQTVPTANLTPEAKTGFLENELDSVVELRSRFDDVALKRAEVLVEAHGRFRKVLGGHGYKVVEPMLPMDLMGIYILLPDNTQDNS